MQRLKQSTEENEPPVPPTGPSFREAFLFWAKLGFISFGGPAGQISILHLEVVERRKWISEEKFLAALNFCMLLPGPEAQQLATYLGWKFHGIRGGIVAGVLFLLPAVVLLWALSWLAMESEEIPWAAYILQGLQPAVLAIVSAAVIRLGSRTLKSPLQWTIAIAALALVAIHTLFPLVLVGAGLIGALFLKKTIEPGNLPPPPKHPWGRILSGGLVLWWTPLLLTGLIFGFSSIFFQQGVFFSKTALVTFGGAYAILPYVAQQAVDKLHWLDSGQMMTGLGLAETTPGPLIMVLQYVGFVGAWQHPGELSPLMAGTIGAAVTTWSTFLPGMLLVLLGAPYVERARGVPSLNGALSGISAAVVGVILNLALWFGVHLIFPQHGKTDFLSLGIAATLFLLIRFEKCSAVLAVALGAASGILRWQLGF